jgi:hypothetical protein
MLSVRLPSWLEEQLAAHCESTQQTKTGVVQQALEKHLKDQALTRRRTKGKPHPLEAYIGSGNRKYTTDEIMRMTRGDDWNKP